MIVNGYEINPLADLSRADLSGADLFLANLSGADLRVADLSGVDLSDTVLSGIKYDKDTIWPEGFTPPASC